MENKLITRKDIHPFKNRVILFFIDLYRLPKKLINKARKNKHEANKAEALNVHYELAKSLAKLKVDRKHLIHLINSSKNNDERKQLNQLLNKVDAQLKALR